MADEKVDPEGFVRANIHRRVVTGKEFASYYSNDTQVQTTPWDVRFMFGVIADVDPDERTAVVERVADVRMSLEHAKKVSMILAEQIRQHEARIGFIALPPD